MAAGLSHRSSHPALASEGNILIYILVGIMLVGLLSAAIRQGSDTGKDLDQERLGIKATEVQRYAAQIQAAVSTVLQSGVSESDLRFAQPKAPSDYGTITDTPKRQVFHPNGGNAEYKLPPAGVQATSQRWEFFSHSAMPFVGSDKADLIMVLPNVSQEFCTAINRQLGFGTTMPQDTSDCFYSATASDRFAGTFSVTPNTLDTATFDGRITMQACARCGSAYHYYYVLQAR